MSAPSEFLWGEQPGTGQHKTTELTSCVLLVQCLAADTKLGELRKLQLIISMELLVKACQGMVLC